MKTLLALLLTELLWMPVQLLSQECRVLSFDRSGAVTFWASQTNLYGGFRYTYGFGGTNSWKNAGGSWWNFRITNYTTTMTLPPNAMLPPSFFLQLLCSTNPLPVPPPSFNLSFLEYAYAGGFQSGFTPVTMFPVSEQLYKALFSASNDTNYPPASDVVFTGPPGSGLSGSPAQDANISGTHADYFSTEVFSPVSPPAGVWTVNYKGTNQTFNVPDPQAASRLVIPFPTASVSGGVLQSVGWVYRDAASGAILGGAPSYVTRIQLQIDGIVGGRIYDSPDLTPNTTSHVLTSTVNWSNVSGMYFDYKDSLGNDYVVTFSKP